MAVPLYRLGRWSFVHRRLVLAGWLLVLIAAAGAAGVLKGSTNDAFDVPGTESQQAIDLLARKFPGTGGATARIVIAAPPGHTLAEARYRSLLAPTVALADRVPQTVGAPGLAKTATVSKDGRIAYADLHFAVSVDKLKASTKAALQRVAGPARRAGLEVEFSGGVISTGKATQSISELVGIVAAFIVLMIAFGTLSAAGLPLLTAIIGVAIGLAGFEGLTGVVKLSSTAPTLALMLGLAVGIDYALFIVSRHRQQLADGLDPEESVARAVATAGSAVVFAGTTVVIALAGLTVVGIPFLAVMGLAAAGTVVVAVLIALTLLPALLGFAGARAGKGRRLTPTQTSGGARWAALVTRHPPLTITAVIAVLAVVALPALHPTQGLPDAGSNPKSDTQRLAYDLLSKGFGPGFNGTLTVVVDASAHPQLHGVGKAAAQSLRSFPDVANVSPPTPNADRQVWIVTLTPNSAPASQATSNLVALIRQRAAQATRRYGLKAYITGATAFNIDTSNTLSSALPVYLILVVGLALVLLMVVFRSLLVPLTAVIGFLLTIVATLGVVVFVFQQGHLGGLFGVQSKASIISFLPILVAAILFGLAMDYQVFLVSRIRENYVHTRDPTHAVTSGFTASARVITAAAIIMICVFGSFIFGGQTAIKSIGLALAFGVLADAFLARMTLIPAVLKLLGHTAWKLPKPLDRLLPNVDIEGEQLTQYLSTESRRNPQPNAPQPNQ